SRLWPPFCNNATRVRYLTLHNANRPFMPQPHWAFIIGEEKGAVRCVYSMLGAKTAEVEIHPE
ncbi:MAG: hypothetical protein PHX82_15070, partial [Paracoccaceae bacterium]|nr:hypothetical protein [Paracoccaceae bacterium]